jgi:hypothetical protein
MNPGSAMGMPLNFDHACQFVPFGSSIGIV